MADSQKKSANIEDCYSLEQSTAQGLKFTIGNQTVYVNGTSTGNYPQIYINGRNSRTNLEAGKTYTGAVYAYNIPDSSTVYVRIQGYDGSDWTKIQDIVYGTPVTFTMPTDGYSDYRLFLICRGTGITYRSMSVRLMINEGETVLPYEPYSPTGWLHSLRKLTTATEAVENPLYSDGTAITAYTLKGNTVQNGTPSPQNPVMPNGVGKRTENLFDSSFTVGYYLNATTGLPQTTPEPRMATLTPIDVTDYDSVTFNFTRETSYLLQVMYSILDGNTLVSRVAGQSVPLTIDTSNATKLYLGVYPPDSSKQVSPDSISSVMLSEGSTAKPYEPYGYKIPISSGGVTTNIYLGSTQTTRQIKKLVLKGQENYEYYSVTQGSLFRLINYDIIKDTQIYGYVICSHFSVVNVANRTNNTLSGSQRASGTAMNFDFIKNDYTTADDFKAYLAQQYAAGTPVTVWYVLATPETAAVNEPLMKIGSYTDTLSNAASIPTTEGANSITVDTTVQPSEFTATWTGWHDASVKEYDGSDWN